MITNLRRGVALGVVAVVLTFVYALVATGFSQLVFKHQADGSITANGSTLIGQNWSHLTTFDGTKAYWPSTRWFNGRPDATGPYSPVVCGPHAPSSCTPASGGDNPLEANGVSGESAATNLGPRSQALLSNTKALVAWWHSQGIDPTPDLVTTSGSGYDPDISLEDALVQVPMISRSTGIAQASLTRLVNDENNSAQLGFLGSSYIDVLQLNEGLAKLH